MSPQAASAGENILHLEQALELIGRLTDEQFTRCPSAPFKGGVGSQFRHCIDFYGCFLQGLDNINRRCITHIICVFFKGQTQHTDRFTLKAAHQLL